MKWPAVYWVRAVIDSEGGREAPAMVTPEGTWASTTDPELWRVMLRANDRRWNARLRS